MCKVARVLVTLTSKCHKSPRWDLRPSDGLKAHQVPPVGLEFQMSEEYNLTVFTSIRRCVVAAEKDTENMSIFVYLCIQIFMYRITINAFICDAALPCMGRNIWRISFFFIYLRQVGGSSASPMASLRLFPSIVILSIDFVLFIPFGIGHEPMFEPA